MVYHALSFFWNVVGGRTCAMSGSMEGQIRMMNGDGKSSERVEGGRVRENAGQSA